MKYFSLAAFASLFVFPAYAVDDFFHPESTGKTASLAGREAVSGHKFMVSAAHPLAVQAGVEVLKQGGNAMDAAIATQLALNVVEPQSSGIGGGGFLLYYDAAAHRLLAYDGRETAPDSVDEHWFQDKEGEPLAFLDAVQGGRSVGIPGLLLMMEKAHKAHGSAEWGALFAPAIHLAQYGFPMSDRLLDLLKSSSYINKFPKSVKPFSNKEGGYKRSGETVYNPELAQTLSTLALKGSKAFYEGEIAQKIVDAVEHSPIHPGELSLSDLKKYRVEVRKPVCALYHAYTICSMPPPSSGGITLLQALGILSHLRIAEQKPLSAQAAHLLTEASKLAYADRNRYLADPAFFPVPQEEMLASDYLAGRAGLISQDRASGKAQAGSFTGYENTTPPVLEEAPSTTHISVVDAQGNAVSMTTSIENGFGSGLSAGGFLLNNQLTDFSFDPLLEDGKTPHPNRVEAGKRPRSSMSPTMIFDETGKPVLVIGSPGGARIIAYVLQTIVAVLDWKLDIQTAISLPKYLNMNGSTELEATTELESLAPTLEAMGHDIHIGETPSGLHGISIGHKEDSEIRQLLGGADPRREGVAIGE